MNAVVSAFQTEVVFEGLDEHPVPREEKTRVVNLVDINDRRVKADYSYTYQNIKVHVDIGPICSKNYQQRN